MKKAIILMTAIIISTNACAFDLGGLVDKAAQLKNVSNIVPIDTVNRSNSKRAWCRSLKTDSICEKTFYDMYCINSDYDRPELSLTEEAPVEGHLGLCIFEKQETIHAGKYNEVYKVKMLCEIQKNSVDNTYSCRWRGHEKTLIRKEKVNTSLEKEVMI